MKKSRYKFNKTAGCYALASLLVLFSPASSALIRANDLAMLALVAVGYFVIGGVFALISRFLKVNRGIELITYKPINTIVTQLPLVVLSFYAEHYLLPDEVWLVSTLAVWSTSFGLVLVMACQDAARVDTE